MTTQVPITTDDDPTKYAIDMSSVNFRAGRLYGEAQTSLQDFRWLSEQREALKMSLKAAMQRLLVERSAEAATAFEAVMDSHYYVMGTRVGTAASRLERLITDVQRGEAEQQRQRDAYRKRIVQESARRSPLPISRPIAPAVIDEPLPIFLTSAAG